MRSSRALFVALPLSLLACSSSSSTPPGGDGGGGDTGVVDTGIDVMSKCGQPGDQGNSLGVGRFCLSSHDCTSTPMAHLCSTLGSSDTFFCTLLCTAPPDGGSEGGAEGGVATDAGNMCGENATCVCQSGGGPCGCTPTACL